MILIPENFKVFLTFKSAALRSHESALGFDESVPHGHLSLDIGHKDVFSAQNDLAGPLRLPQGDCPHVVEVSVKDFDLSTLVVGHQNVAYSN